MYQIGESFVGSGANAAHINTVLGDKEGPVGTAWATSLATPRSGHVPFLTTYKPNLPVVPMTLFVNKAPAATERHEELTWGAAQAGIAAGVRDALKQGSIDSATARDLVLIVAVWVNPHANSESEVYENNRAATAEALRRGSIGEPSMETLLNETAEPHNAYYKPE